MGFAEGEAWGQRPPLLTCLWWCPKSSSACGEGTGDSSVLLFLSLSFFGGVVGSSQPVPRLGGPQACLVSASLYRGNSMTKPLRPSGMLTPHQKPVLPASVATMVFYGIKSLLGGRTLGCVRAFASGSLAKSCFANLRLNFCAWVARWGGVGLQEEAAGWAGRHSPPAALNKPSCSGQGMQGCYVLGRGQRCRCRR